MHIDKKRAMWLGGGYLAFVFVLGAAMGGPPGTLRWGNRIYGLDLSGAPDFCVVSCGTDGVCRVSEKRGWITREDL